MKTHTQIAISIKWKILPRKKMNIQSLVTVKHQVMNISKCFNFFT
jgi:hypothetical protein